MSKGLVYVHWLCKNAKFLREYRRQYRHRIRQKAIGLLGGKCKRCGFKDYRALQIDHKNGKGYGNQRRGYRYIQKVIFEIIRNPKKARKKYQCLCANCNWIKRFVRKEY